MVEITVCMFVPDGINKVDPPGYYLSSWVLLFCNHTVEGKKCGGAIILSSIK